MEGQLCLCYNPQQFQTISKMQTVNSIEWMLRIRKNELNKAIGEFFINRKIGISNTIPVHWRIQSGITKSRWEGKNITKAGNLRGQYPPKPMTKTWFLHNFSSPHTFYTFTFYSFLCQSKSATWFFQLGVGIFRIHFLKTGVLKALFWSLYFWSSSDAEVSEFSFGIYLLMFFLY